NRRLASSRRNKQTVPRLTALRTYPSGRPSGSLSKHKWSVTGPLPPVTAPHTEANLTRQYAANNYSSCLTRTCDAWLTSVNAGKDSQNSYVTTNDQLPYV